MFKDKGLVGKNLFQSKNDYGENAGIVYGLSLATKVENCIVINENGVLAQKTTFKGFNQNINNITFKDFLDLEQGKTLKNVSKLKWKRELAGIEKPHRKVGSENCDNSKKYVDCEIKPEVNCFNCEIKKSCQDCLSKITRIAKYSVEINKLNCNLKTNLVICALIKQQKTTLLLKNPFKKSKNVVNVKQK